MSATPTAFRLLPFGRVELDRPLSGGDFTFTREHAAQAVSAFSRAGGELGVDYNHETYRGGLAPAAGWIRGLEVRGDGLYATRVNWTPRGEAALLAGEQRYISPVVFWRGDRYGGEVERLGLPALTNDPAIRGAPPLMASRDGRSFTVCRPMLLSNRGDVEQGRGDEARAGNQPKEPHMQRIAKALGLAADAGEAAILAEIAKLMQAANKSGGEEKPTLMSSRDAVIGVGLSMLARERGPARANRPAARTFINGFLGPVGERMLTDEEARRHGLLD